MDLFEYMSEQNKEKESPLASRLRPDSLEEVVGQQHIIGKTSFCTVRSKQINFHRFYFTVRPGRERRHWQR